MPKTNVSPRGNVPRTISRVPPKIGTRLVEYCRRCDTYYYPECYYNTIPVCLNCGCVGYSANSTYPSNDVPEIDRFNSEQHERFWEAHPTGGAAFCLPEAERHEKRKK